jgi:hypothetical protein
MNKTEFKGGRRDGRIIANAKLAGIGQQGALATRRPPGPDMDGAKADRKAVWTELECLTP